MLALSGIDRSEVVRISGLFKRLSLEDVGAVTERMIEVELLKDTFLFRQGDAADGLYLVVDGELAVFTERPDGTTRPIGTVGAGGWLGETALLLAGARTASVRATTAATLLFLPASAFQEALVSHPSLRRVLGSVIALRLPRLKAAGTRLLGELDDALASDLEPSLSWVRLRRGEFLFHEGEEGDALYVLIQGRLQVLRERDGELEAYTEVGRGEPVGEMALLTREPRSSSVRALRDCELIRVSEAGFDTLLERHPRALLPVVQTLTHRLRARTDGRVPVPSASTIALVPLGGAPAEPWLVNALVAALSEHGNVLPVSAASFDCEHGRGASRTDPDDPRWLALGEWMSHQESAHDVVFYIADPSADGWSERCIRQADRILLVAPASAKPGLGALEVLLSSPAGSAPRELLLHHPAQTAMPSGTKAWLDAVRVERHHHVRLGRGADVRRAARFLMNRAVGVVLSGGGARGFGHTGVLQALDEAGVPVDFVAGVSMGALAAAAYASGLDRATTEDFYRRAFWKPGNLTLPILSVFEPRRGERLALRAFGETKIEDLWLGYLAVATDITRARLRVFRDGLLWRAVRASGAFPGLVSPLPENGTLLVDGAMMTNLPIELTRQHCPGFTVASDVSGDVEMEVDPRLETAPTPGELLMSRLNPARRAIRYPGMASVLLRSVLCRDVAQRAAQRKLASLYLTPGVSRFSLLDFANVNAIVEAGYRSTVDALRDIPKELPRC